MRALLRYLHAYCSVASLMRDGTKSVAGYVGEKVYCSLMPDTRQAWLRSPTPCRLNSATAS